MKKIVLIIALAVSSIAALAQSNLKNLQSDQGVHKAGLDTVVNAGTISQVLQIPGYQDQVIIMTGVTKLTGTPAGVVKLYGSLDGVKYDYVNGPDSLVVANVAPVQIKTWKIVPSAFQYYKAVYKSTASTQTSTIVTTSLARKK